MPDGIPVEISTQTAAFIKRMAAVFGAPDTASSSEFKAILDGKIGGYQELVLIAAADHFIETRRSWPKIADIVGVAKQKSVEMSPARSRVDFRARAEDLRDQWFEQRVDGNLIDKAEAEGWTDRLWNDVMSIAWGLQRKGNVSPFLSDLTPRYDDWSLKYNADQARAIREGAEYRKSEEFLRRHGQDAVRKPKDWSRTQCESSAAIRAQMEEG